MIQAILSYQFLTSLDEKNVIQAEFKPLHLFFHESVSEKFTKEDYAAIITEADIFTVFYQHTTGMKEIKGRFSNYFMGRVKQTPYQVISFFYQEQDGSQFLTICLFEIDDELDIFKEQVEIMGKKMEDTLQKYVRALNSRKIDLIDKESQNAYSTLKLTLWQLERLSNLDKLQKVGLIFSTEERVKILEALREHPKSKRELKRLLEMDKPYINIDVLLDPFVELNLIRRDWIEGERDKETHERDIKGEYLFLIKDIALVRVPRSKMLKFIKEKDELIFPGYNKQVTDYFTSYDPLEQTLEDTKKMAKFFLNPDMYDFFTLMKENYYGLEKIPKILSEWADTDKILSEFREMNILTVVTDHKKRDWLFLLTDIKPITIFPEYILPNIRKAYKEKKITYEIAKKAYDLLEVTFPENVEFV